MAANRLRRAVQKELSRHGISFPLWWVLYTTECLVRQTDDAVTQQAIALATEMRKNSVSDLMKVLAERSLVDRGPDGLDRSYRIITTRKGSELINATRDAFENAIRRVQTAPHNPSRAIAYCLARLQIDA